MASVVYLLCALTSALCAGLLFYEFRKRQTQLLLWSALSFGCFAISNGIVFTDFVLVPDIDLSLLRAMSAFAAAMLLLFGLVWSLE